MNVSIYTDGGSRGNPGHAAYGFVVYNEAREKIFGEGGYLGINTNNYAEYFALIKALEKSVALGAKKVNIYMDSELIVRQMKGVYRIKQLHLQKLAGEVLRLLRAFNDYNFTHVPRSQNKEADALVNQALDTKMTVTAD